MPIPPLPVHFQWVAVLLAGWVSRAQAARLEYLEAENRVLRAQLGGKPRFTDAQRRLLGEKAKALGWAALNRMETIVTPGTLLRWYRELVAKKYTSPHTGRGGKQPIAEEAEALILKVARENPHYGYGRIQGTLENLGHEVSKTTIARILRKHGIPPAKDRGKRIPWRTFLQTHAVAAADFFTVEVMTLRGLVRYHVFFAIEIATRRVQIGGIRANPDGAWLTQVARNLCDPEEGFLRHAKHLVLDRDPLYCKTFREVLRSSGVKIIRLPPESPNLNAHAERFVRSIKEECLSKLIPLGEAHLRRAVAEFVAHYHLERNHQGLDNALIDPEPGVGDLEGEVVTRERLGGLLRHYHRRSAA